jgi:hypothetical protein
VVPSLAAAMIHARSLRPPTAADLGETYQMALLALFRLLFIAYAEDKGLLPYGANDLYTSRSLKHKARKMAALVREGRPFGGRRPRRGGAVVRPPAPPPSFADARGRLG